MLLYIQKNQSSKLYGFRKITLNCNATRVLFEIMPLEEFGKAPVPHQKHAV